MQVGVRLLNFVPGDEEGGRVFDLSVTVADDGWLNDQRHVYDEVMRGIEGIVLVPIQPHMSGGSGLVTLQAGDRLNGEEIAYIRSLVKTALAPLREREERS